jgi:hypothetical protein
MDLLTTIMVETQGNERRTLVDVSSATTSTTTDNVKEAVAEALAQHSKWIVEMLIE